MRAVVSLVVIGILASNAWATVTARVYLADEETPLAWIDPNASDFYRDIMVGTHLTIFIESDMLEITSGILTVGADDQEQGLLAGRGFDGFSYVDSCLEAAGITEVSNTLTDIDGAPGLQFSAIFPIQTGRWFVFDYYATDTGYCDVNRYDNPGGVVIGSLQGFELDPPSLAQRLSFHHVPSRDFNDDKSVNFADFAYLASKWNQSVVVDPNEIVPPDPNAAIPADPNAVYPQDPNAIRSLDLSDDGFIDANDIWQFSNYWLERTDLSEPNEPNEPAVTDPNLPLEEL